MEPLLCVHTKRDGRDVIARNASISSLDHKCHLFDHRFNRDDATLLPQFSSPPAIFSSTMAELTTVAALYLLWTSDLDRRPKRRHVWVHNILQKRTQLGEYHHLLQEPRLDDSRFQRYFRLTLAQFEDLLARIGARISRLDTNYRHSIPAAERLSICLRLVAYNFFMKMNEIHRINSM